MSDIRIFENRQFEDPARFVTQPNIGLAAGEGDAFAYAITALTPQTAAELRDLADQADRVWADYAAFLDKETR